MKTGCSWGEEYRLYPVNRFFMTPALGEMVNP